MLVEHEAYTAALAFARSNIATWDAEGFRLSVSLDLEVGGCFVFSYGPGPDATGRRRRVGGNWPILVDARTGECRRVAGVEEYQRLQRAMPNGR